MPNTKPLGENMIDISLATRYQIVHTPEAANMVFSAMERAGMSLDFYNKIEPVNIPFSKDKATELWVRGSRVSPERNIFFARCTKPRVNLHVSWETCDDGDCISNITVDMHRGTFQKNQEGMTALFKELIAFFSPVHAYVGSQAGFFRQGGAVWAAIPGVYWLNYYGREYVDYIGMSNIINCGWIKTEPFYNGLLTWTAHSIDVTDASLRHMEGLYRERLGMQYFRSEDSKFAKSIPPELLKIRDRMVGENPTELEKDFLKKLAKKKLNRNNA